MEQTSSPTQKRGCPKSASIESIVQRSLQPFAEQYSEIQNALTTTFTVVIKFTYAILPSGAETKWRQKYRG